MWQRALLVLAVIGTFSSLQPGAAHAATTRHVAPGGATTGDCTASPCASVQYAVQQSGAGDTIVIAAGTYTETSGVTVDKSLTLTGAGSSGSSATTITVKSGTVFTVGGPSGTPITVDISFLAITGGTGTNNQGGNILNKSGSTLTVSFSAVTNGLIVPPDGTPSLGGGVFNASGAVLHLIGTTLDGNQLGGLPPAGSLGVASPGGTADGGGIFNAGTLTLDSTTSVTNSLAYAGPSDVATSGAMVATGLRARGGGIFNAAGANLTIDGATLDTNEANGGAGGTPKPAGLAGGKGGDAQGGAIYNEGVVTISGGATISAGRATGGFGGDTPIISQVQAQAGSGGGAFGGGIYNASGASLTVSDTRVASTQVSAGEPGNSSGGYGAALGGGIYNASLLTLRLTGTFFSDSAFGAGQIDAVSAPDTGGGAIYHVGGAISGNRDVFQGNQVLPGVPGQSGHGGAIFIGNGASLFLDVAKFDNNDVGDINQSSFGASTFGAALDVSNGSAHVSDSTFTRNTTNGGQGDNKNSTTCGAPGTGTGGKGADAFGGAISVGGTLVISNSTIFGNLVRGGRGGAGCSPVSPAPGQPGGNGGSASGGGIATYGSGASVQSTNLTIDGNTSTGGQGGLCGDPNNCSGPVFAPDGVGTGGGVGNANGGIFTLVNTIVAKDTNAGGTSVPSDCWGAFGDGGSPNGGHNLIGNADGCTGLVNNVNGNLVGTTAAPIDPKLSAPADNGGPALPGGIGATQTMMPVAPSPVIDAGNNNACGTAPVGGQDQRDAPRPVGSACDIGAVETGSTPTWSRVTHFSVVRHHGMLGIRWHLVGTGGVRGFNVLAGTHRLNARLIPVHASREYAFHTPWSGPARIRLLILLNHGEVTIQSP